MFDAVITWVDGSAESQRRNREYYLSQAVGKLHENAVNPHRWADNDEILYCLQSIENHAPWIRTIWIVTAGESPDLTALSKATRSKIKYVHHDEIFDGFEAALPTFNSLAIESLLWRIDGLSERFLYFNDDVFLTGLLTPADVFIDMAPVLRGEWVDFTPILERPELRDDPAAFNDFMQINASAILGLNPSRVFSAAHVVHPMRRSLMAQLFQNYSEAFSANIQHRFRNINQFLPQTLHNHKCIVDDGGVFQKSVDNLHIRSGQGNNHPPSETASLLRRINDENIKFLCVNDLPQLEALVPDARELIATAIGGF